VGRRIFSSQGAFRYFAGSVKQHPKIIESQRGSKNAEVIDPAISGGKNDLINLHPMQR
jgi:hypothetical protein